MARRSGPVEVLLVKFQWEMDHFHMKTYQNPMVYAKIGKPTKPIGESFWPVNVRHVKYVRIIIVAMAPHAQDGYTHIVNMGFSGWCGKDDDVSWMLSPCWTCERMQSYQSFPIIRKLQKTNWNALLALKHYTTVALCIWSANVPSPRLTKKKFSLVTGCA